MKPIKFKGHNVTLGKNQPQYSPLPVCYQGGIEGCVTSCWKLTWRERLRLLFTGKIFLSQMTFNSPAQPVTLSTNWTEPVCANCRRPVSAHKRPNFLCPPKSKSDEKKQNQHDKT